MKVDKSLVLKKIKTTLGYEKDVDFANFLGISPQTLASWYSRNTYDFEILYAKCINIDANFLLSGKGEIFLKKDTVANFPEIYHTDKKCEKCIDKERLIVSLQNTIDIQSKLIKYLEDLVYKKNTTCNISEKESKKTSVMSHLPAQ